MAYRQNVVGVTVSDAEREKLVAMADRRGMKPTTLAGQFVKKELALSDAPVFETLEQFQGWLMVEGLADSREKAEEITKTVTKLVHKHMRSK